MNARIVVLMLLAGGIGAGVGIYFYTRGPHVRTLDEQGFAGQPYYVVECPESPYDCAESAKAKCAPDPYDGYAPRERVLEFQCATEHYKFEQERANQQTEERLREKGLR